MTYGGFPSGSGLKNLPAMQEPQEDTLEEGMATHSSVLAWRIPTDRGAWWATVLRVIKSDKTEATSYTHTITNNIE